MQDGLFERMVLALERIASRLEQIELELKRVRESLEHLTTRANSYLLEQPSRSARDRTTAHQPWPAEATRVAVVSPAMQDVPKAGREQPQAASQTTTPDETEVDLTSDGLLGESTLARIQARLSPPRAAAGLGLAAEHVSPDKAVPSPTRRETSSPAAPESESQAVRTVHVRPDPRAILQAWLAQRGLQLQNVALVEATADPWDWFAEFLGQRFDHLRPFYKRWKQSLNTGQSFSLQLQQASARQISDTVQFALELQKASLICSYYYTKTSRLLRAFPCKSPDIINFVTGGWLERYIARLLWRLATQHVTEANEFFIFRNIQLVLPDSQQTELDLLALYRGQAIWLESKTGDYNVSVERWQRNNTHLKIPPQRAGIVLLDMPGTTAQAMLQTRTGMQVVSLTKLTDFLSVALEQLMAA
ncbi:MAG: hypothetical protein GXO54_03100 [Chloroflexi bacterium]|nr:hypothetical protein [Chloroflexota bacterium]